MDTLEIKSEISICMKVTLDTTVDNSKIILKFKSKQSK